MNLILVGSEMSFIVLAMLAMIVMFGIPYLVYRCAPSTRLNRARKRIVKLTIRLAAIERLQDQFKSCNSIKELLEIVNALECKDEDELYKKLDVHRRQCLGLNELIPLLRYRGVCRHADCQNWETADPKAKWGIEWIRAVKFQQDHWERKAASLRVLINDLQASINKLAWKDIEAGVLGVRVDATPALDDKRVQLRKIRSRIEELRPQKDQIDSELQKLISAEQNLEDRILDEQGHPIPNRRPEGVSTD